MNIQEKRKELLGVMMRLRKRKPMLKMKDRLPDHESFMILSIGDLESKNPAGVKISDISEHMALSMPAISQSLRSLEKKGMIERKTAENDRRIVYISLSPEGAVFCQWIYEHSNQHMEKIIERLGEQKTEQMIGLIDEVCNILDNLAREEEHAT